MRVLGACSMGGAGHLNPLLPVLAAARRRGDEVLVVAPASLRQQVEDAGLAFLGGGEPPERDVAPIRERLPIAPAAEATILGNRELFGRLAARAMLPAMQEAIVDWRPDVVIREPCEYASAVVAGRLGIPTAQVAISLAGAERASIEAAAPALRELRTGLAEQLIGSPYLTRFPASLDPSPFPTTLRFREPSHRPTPLPDWWPGSTQPLIYLTFGSVFGHLAGAAAGYRTAVRAVAGLPVRVLLTVGPRFDPSALGPLPANAHIEPWVEQVDALAATTLVVCHGGSGTVYGALAAGCRSSWCRHLLTSSPTADASPRPGQDSLSRRTQTMTAAPDGSSTALTLRGSPLPSRRRWPSPGTAPPPAESVPRWPRLLLSTTSWPVCKSFEALCRPR